MTSLDKVESQKGSWLLVAPVSGLTLTRDIGEEISIDKITFVSKKRLPHVRKRLGFPMTIGELRKKKWTYNFFDGADVYAVANMGGVGCEKEVEFLEAARKELAILSLSQLGYGRRRLNACLSVSSEIRPESLEYFMMNTVKRSWSMKHKLSGRFRTLVLDERWSRYQKLSFFYELIDIIKGKGPFSSGWRLDVKNAALLAGQSQSSSDLPHAFLWNMIAIETLLTHSGDSYSKELPKRVEAFIGWTTNWSLEDYESKVKEAYRKRCALAHAGRVDELKIEDILFTDLLLVNIFYNVLKHLDLFKTKDELIDFSRKVEAEHILGVKPKVRPKTVSFINMRYSDKDYEGI